MDRARNADPSHAQPGTMHQELLMSDATVETDAAPGDVKRSHVIPPAVQAQRMQRYSVYLVVAAFLLVGLNYSALSAGAVLWFAAGLTAAFSLLCAVCVVILHAVAWNFDRLREELRGGRVSRSVGAPDPSASPRPTWHGFTDPPTS